MSIRHLIASDSVESAESAKRSATSYLLALLSPLSLSPLRKSQREGERVEEQFVTDGKEKERWEERNKGRAGAESWNCAVY